MAKNNWLKMKRLKLLVLGNQSLENFHLLAELYIFYKDIALVNGNQIMIGNIMDNMIHRISNYNLLLTTNINSILMIEEHNRLLP